MSANCNYGRGIVLACPIFQPRSGSETSGSERRGGRGEHDRLGRARARRGLGYFGGEVWRSKCSSSPVLEGNRSKYWGMREGNAYVLQVECGFKLKDENESVNKFYCLICFLLGHRRGSISVLGRRALACSSFMEL